MGAPRPEALLSNPHHGLKTIAESLSLHVLRVDCPYVVRGFVARDRDHHFCRISIAIEQGTRKTLEEAKG